MRYRLSHDLASYNLPRVFGFRNDAPRDDQNEIVERLINYYFYMRSESNRLQIPALSGIWSHFSKHFQTFEAALQSRDVERVSNELLRVCTTPLVSGFASYHMYDSIAGDPRARAFESYLTVDRLLSLAEAVGAASPQCPFQIAKTYHDLDLAALLQGVRRRLPFDLRPPIAGGGAFGINTSEGVISNSDILAMYVADRVHQLLRGNDSRTVCEIGGGTGTLAFYLTKTCAARITVADLPIVSIIQGYYLLKSAGRDAVCLSGEARREARVNIIPYWELDVLADTSVDLFINVDSMPEIDADIAERYISIIKRSGRQFLSINQEAEYAGQSVVRNLTEKMGGYERIYRFPYWMISGYCEELFRIAGP